MTKKDNTNKVPLSGDFIWLLNQFDKELTLEEHPKAS